MALRSHQLILTAVAQRLSNAYGGASAGNRIDPAQDIPYRQLLLQAAGGDAFIGGTDATTSTNHGTKVASTDLQPVTLGPFDTGPLHLSDVWVAGANATIHVTGIPF